MNKIYLNAVDITDKVAITSFKLEENFSSLLDSLSVSFDGDTQVFYGDKIKLLIDNFDSGTFFVDSFEKNASKMSINALSVLQSNATSNIWKSTSLFSIAKTIASDMSLGFLYFGSVLDFSYDFLSQINMTDLKFLNNIATSEGYNLKVSDGNLIIYDADTFSYEKITISKAQINSGCSFEMNSFPLRSVTVLCYYDGSLISSTYQDDSFKGRDIVINRFATSEYMAQRMAKAHFLGENRNIFTGFIEIPLSTDVLCGSKILLTGFDDTINGDYFVYKSIISPKKTSLFVRKEVF